MFSMCSELTPCAHIPDTRIPQLMQPCHMEAKFDKKNIPPEDLFGHCYKYSPLGHLHVFVWQHFHFSRIQNICFAPVDLSENGGN